MTIQYATTWDGKVLAKCSREDAIKLGNNGGVWRMYAGNLKEVVDEVEKSLGHAGFEMVEVPMGEFELQ